MSSQFVQRLLDDAASTMHVVMAAIGERLGLWKDLATRGPATSHGLAHRLRLSERHVREWLAAMAAARYLTYDAATGTFALPPEHACLADGAGLPGTLVAYLAPYERLLETFRTGGGVPHSAYPAAAHDGHLRLGPESAAALIPRYSPALAARLADGIAVCDVGCGTGRGTIALAEAYPRSRFVGYDAFGPSIARARAAAERAGVTERVTFAQVDAAAGLPERFDLVTTCHVLHDAVEPARVLGAIRSALRAGGAYACVELVCAPALEDNLGSRGALLHGISVLYCLSTTLAHGGPGLGTCGLHARALVELGRAAGFERVDEVATEDPWHALYVLA